MTTTLGQAAPVATPPRRVRALRPQTRRRRWWLLAIAVALLSVAGTVVLVVGNGPTKERPWSFGAPSAYSVTYAITTAGASPSTERLWVRRPFDSVDITYAGPPPGTSPSLFVVYRLGVQVLKAANAEAGLLHIPAAAPPPDVRADVIVPAALRAHRAVVVGHDTELGRPCQLIRSAAPLRAGSLPPLQLHARYVESCIDRDGIVLRERQLSGGHVLSERRAVQVQTGDSAVADASFGMSGTPTPFNSGGGAFTPLTLTSRPPGGSWALDQPPAGFRQVGKYAAVPPQPQLFGGGGNGFGSMGLPGGLVTEMDDVFVRGTDFLVLQQGSTLNGAAFTPPGNSLAVDLGRLGHGQLLLAGNSTTVVAEPGNGKGFVRLSGTLPPDRLIALMRELAKEPGGTLTRLAGVAG